MSHNVRVIALLLMIMPLLSGAGAAGPSVLTEDACLPAAREARGASTPTCDAQSSQVEAGVYRIYYGSQDRLAELARNFDIWEVNPQAGYAVLLVGEPDAVRLRARSYRLELAEEQTQKWLLGPPFYPCYRDVGELYAALHQMAASYPTLVELIDYGDSWRQLQGLSGYDLWALKLTNRQSQATKPCFFLMANIHARELTTPETAMYFVRYLLENYGIDADVTWILDYHEIYVVVTANPDGRQLVEDSCYQRKNLNDTLGLCIRCDPWGNNHYGVDLNRNHPYQWGGASSDPCGETYQGVSAASEPETYYFMDLIRSLFPDQRPVDDSVPAPRNTSGVLVSLHSYGNLVLWPWGWTTVEAPNGPQLRTLGRKFAYLNGYMPEPSNALYRTTGDTTDWAYGELGIPAYTFELGEFFFQSCDDLQQIMEENMAALLYAARISRGPYSTPAGPDALNLSVSPVRVLYGDTVRLTATIDDSRYSSANGEEPVQNVAAAAYYVDVPPWVTTTTAITTSMTVVDGKFDEVTEEVAANLDTRGLSETRHTLFVRGQDQQGNWGAFSAIFFSVAGRPSFSAYLPIVVNQD